MPLLSRGSYDGSLSASADVSRPFFEQKGLGIYTKYERPSARSEEFNNATSRSTSTAFHIQSTSPVSQSSTPSSSSICKPGSQYVHPMRLAPRAYTPPLNQSCQTSILGSDSSIKDQSTGGNSPMSSGSDAYHPSPEVSQTSRSSFGYSRDNGSTLDTTSPVSRSSLDFIFRSKTRTSMDPVARAATVQAARQAFEEKEAAKTWRFEAQQMKTEVKQTKQRERQEGRTRFIHDKITQTSQKEEVHEKPQPSSPQLEPGTWKPKNTWVLCLTWLRTRVFKVRRRFRKLA
ncbi:hypothetical protein BO71DRAFT_364832 [Aspergillus ellipticus CBS 707.79]|uniref:Uncharacterized protein n=1 Tax=Aspergillus ellipticus CBS 707.79 TaxID=1448320 RepID=A0A319DCN7_9EURO|nr:hypothetical protein BO71DRAFT_364832 [Aspergillus ellipticus CBS 707.79]